jgi:hypothetical protein
MSTHQQSVASETEAIKLWREKIEDLRNAEAVVSNASAKFEIKKEIEEAQSRLGGLLAQGLVGGELGLEAVDAELLSSYFAECAKHDSWFESHLRGEDEPRRQFLISKGLAFVSSKGATALTDEGILFCAIRELISSTRFHVYVQLHWGEGKSATQEHIWGSILYLHRELLKRLNSLTSRVMGNPEHRNTFGSEIAIREYPIVAIIEALTNFLIHRDYREDDHGRIKVYNDRIEFINPGLSAVPPDVLLSSNKDLEPKYSRNSRVIEAMSLARLNQRAGSGIRRIREALEENGTVQAGGRIGLNLWNDEDKNRFHLTIFRRDLTTFAAKEDISSRVITALKAELAEKGQRLDHLSQQDLERELASRASGLSSDDIRGLAESVRFRADISRIIKYAPADLIGREPETQLLTDAWTKAQNHEPNRPHILTFVGLGGEGKTSLVAKWAADLAHQDWPGCDTTFAWSFYSQGTRDQTAVSSDLFLSEALAFFGDAAMAASPQSAFDKARRLAHLVGQRRTLLILDGLEPLQYAPTSPTPGELKDQGIAALLKALATTNNGLCVVTTRYAISDLRAYWRTTAPMHELLRLSTAAGVKLLRTVGVKTGSQADFERLVEDVEGHALTLQIFGQFLVRAFHGDIRRRDRIDIQKADAKIQGGHAFRAMESYVKWLENDTEESRREVAVLSLLGLFDRPASADCVAALRQAPAIPNLTEPLIDLAEDDWEFSLTALRDAKLLTVNREQGSGSLISLDAHPLLREYFAKRLREQQPDAWRAAQRRLYEHLCATTKESDQPTLEDLQPLYQAVAHGCQAGLQQEACNEVYFARILRGREAFSTFKLGAFGSDLGAIACFFDIPWIHISSTFPEAEQAWLLGEAAFRLRALGRLTEALEPMRAGQEKRKEQQDWESAAIIASNLSELELTLGEVAGAVADAEQSVIYADRSGDAFSRRAMRGTHADALHQVGRWMEAEARFREAEAQQAGIQPDYPLLYSLHGFRYCDLLLTEPERAAWQLILRPETQKTKPETAIAACIAVSKRAAHTLRIAVRNNLPLLDIAMDHLTLGRAALYAAILEKSAIRSAGGTVRGGPACGDNSQSAIDSAVSGLRRAGTQDHFPRALLTRAWLRSLTGPRTGPESAQTDLDEAWEIAERGPMPLFLADIHLHRARLFGSKKLDGGSMKYPWISVQHDLSEARRLIEKHGYWRRKEELEDAESALRPSNAKS